MGGVNNNHFFDVEQNEGHYNSGYTPDYGYHLGVAIENIRVDWLNFRFTLSYDSYGGQLKVTDGGLAWAITTEAQTDKSVIALGVFPVNFKIKKRFDLNLGIEFSGLIHENYSGTISVWQIDEPNWSFDLEEQTGHFSSKIYIGLRGRVAYDFNISENWAFSPQYSFYFGLTKEFDEFPETTKSMKHYFCIGLQRKLN